MSTRVTKHMLQCALKRIDLPECFYLHYVYMQGWQLREILVPTTGEHDCSQVLSAREMLAYLAGMYEMRRIT